MPRHKRRLEPWLLGLIFAVTLFALALLALGLLGFGDDPVIEGLAAMAG